MTNREIAQFCMDLWVCNHKAYNIQWPTGVVTPEGKHEFDYLSIKNPPYSVEIWENHLFRGQRKDRIGLIPELDDHTCRWGLIDVDVYDKPERMTEILALIIKLRWPCIAYRSKSGALHIVFFFKENIPVSDVQRVLLQLSKKLNIKCEQFPKSAPPALGMPYAHDSMACAFAPDGSGALWTIQQFVEYAQQHPLPISKKEFLALEAKDALVVRQTKVEPVTVLPKSVNEMLEGMAICVQRIFGNLTEPMENRNNTFFVVAPLFKAKYPTIWDQVFRWINQRLVNPLESKELETLIKQGAKDFPVSCDKCPIKDHCDRAECIKQPYGIGGEKITRLSSVKLEKLDTVPPLWYMHVKKMVVAKGSTEKKEVDIKLELTTAQLMTYSLYSMRHMEVTNIMPEMMKQAEWSIIVRGMLQNVSVVDIDYSETPQGLLEDGMHQWLESEGGVGSIKDIVLNGKPYKCEDEGVIYFRRKDLTDWIILNKIMDLKANQITGILTGKMGGVSFKKRIGKSNLHVWTIPILKDKQDLLMDDDVIDIESNPF